MAKYLWLPLYVLWILFLPAIAAEKEAGESLYDKSDAGINIFDGATFDSNVYDSNVIWLVEFYNQWCGHCIRYAPVFKDFAKDVQGWENVVKIGTVNCASPQNTEICRTKDIMAYPTIRMYKAHSKPEDMGETREAVMDMVKLRKTLVKDLLTASEGVDWPETFPRLQPLESMDEIWTESPNHHQFAILVFEEELSDVGTEIILDMLSNEQFVVRRMLKEAVSKYAITSFPSVYQIHRDGIFQRIAPKATKREEFVAALKDLAGASKHEQEQEKVRGDDSDKLYFETPNKEAPKHTTGLHMKDLESGLHYSLRQEVALRHSISGEELDALKLYIKVLTMYFPGRKPVVTFLQRLNSWLEQSKSEISGEEWLTKLDSLQTSESYLPEKVEWICCRGSQPKFRGYPCSMWSLFHTLTVAAHTYKRDGDNQPRLVLSAMRGYIKHFFGCKECSQNFYKMAAKLEKEVESSQDSVLWLWQAHNRANARLHGDASEDPAHAKIQFPSEKDCPDCLESRNGKGNPIWHEEKVFEYLLKYYDAKNIVDDAEAIPVDGATNRHPQAVHASATADLDWWELQQRKKDLEKLADIRLKKRDRSKFKKQETKTDSSNSIYGNNGLLVSNVGKSFVTPSGFNQIDVSLCMLLWIVSSGIVILLYFHIMVRRKKKICSLLPL